MTAAPVRAVAVLPEPTPYRTPLFDLLAARSELDFHAVYAAEAIAGNRWSQEIAHPHTVLRGMRVPGARAVLRHDYPVTPAIGAVLSRLRPDCLVITGWSTFASQAAIVWCRLRRVPYVLQVESHDADPRSGWRRAVKGAVVPRVVRGASSVLVTGSLSRDSMIARGSRLDRIRVFANTVDTGRFAELADARRGGRPGLRARLGVGGDDVLVLSVARLAREKGLDTLIRAAADAGDPRVRLVVAGEGPEREALQRLADELDVHLLLLGAVDRERLLDLYAAADVFALLSRHEPWAVVVNEAAACGLPLLLSDRVGAAYDLLEDGVNGILVPADDVPRAAGGIARLAADPALRSTAGAASAAIAARWGYGPSVASFVDAVHEAARGSVRG